VREFPYLRLRRASSHTPILQRTLWCHQLGDRSTGARIPMLPSRAAAAAPFAKRNPHPEIRHSLFYQSSTNATTPVFFIFDLPFFSPFFLSSPPPFGHCPFLLPSWRRGEGALLFFFVSALPAFRVFLRGGLLSHFSFSLPFPFFPLQF